jgi:O-antigen/teichoic acid export membrane protein
VDSRLRLVTHRKVVMTVLAVEELPAAPAGAARAAHRRWGRTCGPSVSGTVREGASMDAADGTAVRGRETDEQTDVRELAAPPADDGISGLFGRGLLYVAVSSLQLLGAVVVSPVLAHMLAPAEFGQLSSAIALHQALVVLAVMGLDQAIVIMRAEAGNDRPTYTVLAVGLAVASLVTAAATVTAPMWAVQLGFAGANSIVLTTLAWTPPAAGLMLVLTLLLGQDRLKAYAWVSAVAGVGGQAAGMAILLITGARTAHVYALGTLASLGLTLIVGLVLTRPRWRGLKDVEVARRALSLGVPLMVGGLALYVLNVGDRLVIQRLLGATEAGRYQIAYLVGNVAVLLIGIISWAWGPQITAVRDDAKRWILLASARDGLLRLTTPMLVGVTLGAPVLLRIAAPPSFAPGELLLVVFLVATASFPVAVGSASGRALVTLGRGKALAVVAVIAALLNLGLNIVLVPIWGLVGAAVATTVSFTAQACLHRLALPRQIAWPSIGAPVRWAAVAAVVVSALSLQLPQTTGWNAVRFLLALACLPWLLHQLRAIRAGSSR